MTFFNYESPYRTGQFIELNTFEYTIPFLVLFVLVGALVYYRDRIRENPRFMRLLQLSVGTIFTIVYLSHYILRYRLYGFDTIILPFQLCGISMIFAILLLFTENKTIHAFVLYTGVLGGLVSLITPVMGYDSSYYRYYQFYIAHLLLIVTPLYFLIVKAYYPTLKETIVSFLVLQGLAIFMGIFNVIYGTDYMFIFFDPDKVNKFPAIATFGGVPWYLIWVELTGILAFFIFYRGIVFVQRKAQNSTSYNHDIGGIV